MAIAQRLIGSGIAPQAAVNTVGDTVGGLTATGTTISDAYRLTTVNSHFSTVAIGTGAQLIPCNPGDSQMVFNQGANALLVYPPSASETLQAGAAGAGFSVAANKAAIFTKFTNTALGVNLSA